MYYMLSGEFPYVEPNLADKIQTAQLGFEGDRWSYVAYETKDLIRKLLDKNPE